MDFNNKVSTRDFIRIRVEDDLKSLQREFSLVADGIPNAAARAMNRTLSFVRAEGIRIAREEYTQSAASIRANTSILRATRNELSGMVDFYGWRGSRLHKFQITPKLPPHWKGVNPRLRQPELGISARIRKAGESKPRTGPEGEKSFWAMGLRGEAMIFYRPKNWREQVAQWMEARGTVKVGKRGRKVLRDAYLYKKQTKSPLVPMYGPSPIDALTRPGAQERLEDGAWEMYQTRLSHEINNLFRGITR